MDDYQQVLAEAIPLFAQFCQLFGLFWLLLFGLLLTIRSVVFVWNNVTKRGVKWCGGPTTWAVVTGATDGIGLEYARQLAAKDYNLFLLSRNQAKLERVSQEIRGQHPDIKVKVSLKKTLVNIARS